MLNLPTTASTEKGSALIIRIKQLFGCKKLKINFSRCYAMPSLHFLFLKIILIVNHLEEKLNKITRMFMGDSPNVQFSFDPVLFS